MVAEDLLAAGLSSAGLGHQPVEVALVKVRAHLLGQRGVRRLADQRVPERECPIAVQWAQQLLACQPHEHASGELDRLLAQHRDVLCGGADADHGGRLDRRSLGHRQPIKPRRQESLDGRRDLQTVPPLRREGQQLLDEQRVAAGHLHHPLERAAVRQSQPLGQRPARVERERLQQHGGRVDLAAAPAGTQLEQLGPGQAEQQQRRVARPLGQVLEQVEHGRLCPVDVLEHDDQRLARGQLEQPSHGSEGGLAHGRRRAQHAGDTRGDCLSVIRAGQHGRRTVRATGEFPHHLGQG